MKSNNSNIANFHNQLINQLDSTMKFQGEIIENAQISSNWRKSFEKVIDLNNYPYYLIFPHTINSLTQIVKSAYKNNCRIFPLGNGSKIDWGSLEKNIDLVVSTHKINNIIDYAVEDLTITVEAGVKLADLQAILAKNQQFLPIDPSYPDNATLGGIVATSDTGSWRQRYGGIRDLVIGLSFVRYDGEIAKAGGKVVKNVAGYDLMKLFTGSYGSLGIITEITLRLYPLPESSATIIITGESNNIAKARQAIVSSGLTPTAADLLSSSLVKSLNLGEEMALMIRFQSIKESVNQQVKQVESLAKELNLKVSRYNDNEEENLWKQVKEKVTIATSESAIIGKIGVLPSQSVNFFNTFNYHGFIHISSGLGKIYLDKENPLTLLNQMRNFCHENQGFMTILESPKIIKEKIEPWGYLGNARVIMQQIKNKFDPQNIFKNYL